jgi:hypothetical protein
MKLKDPYEYLDFKLDTLLQKYLGSEEVVYRGPWTAQPIYQVAGGQLDSGFVISAMIQIENVPLRTRETFHIRMAQAGGENEDKLLEEAVIQAIAWLRETRQEHITEAIKKGNGHFDIPTLGPTMNLRDRPN